MQVVLGMALLLIGALMVSTFRYNSFKKLDLRKRWSYRAFVPFAAILLVFLFIPRATLLVITVLYTLSGARRRRVLAPALPARAPARRRAAARHLGRSPVTAIAILHPMGLLGKELRETLGTAPGFAGDVRLLSSRDDEIGTLTEVAGAAAMVTRYEPETLRGVPIAFFCGSMEDNRPLLAELPPETTAILLSLDATVEDGLPVVAGVNTEAARGHRVLLSPHPGVVLLAHLLHALRELEPRRRRSLP